MGIPFVTEDLSLKAMPGTCKLSPNAAKTSTVTISGKKVFINQISFSASGGTWTILTGCNGNGMIPASSCSNVFMNGGKPVLQTDTGQCQGIGYDPQGKPMPCNCTVIITKTQNSVTH